MCEQNLKDVIFLKIPPMYDKMSVGLTKTGLLTMRKRTVLSLTVYISKVDCLQTGNGLGGPLKNRVLNLIKKKYDKMAEIGCGESP